MKFSPEDNPVHFCPDDALRSPVQSEIMTNDSEIEALVDELDAIVRTSIDEVLFVTEGSAFFSPERLRLSSIIVETRKKIHVDTIHNSEVAKARRTIDAYRKDEGRDGYNKKRRSDYASEVMLDQTRAVRAYEKGTPERRAAQKKASKMKAAAAMSDDQREALRKKDRLRKLESRIVNSAIAELDME